MKTRQSSAPDRSAPRLLVLILLVMVIASVASFDYLPTHDGPQHIYTIHASNHLDDASKGYGRWFDANIPISAIGFAVLFAPLDQLLDWKAAVRIALVLMTGLWVVGAYCFAVAVHPGRRWAGLALGAAAFQWSLYMGFFSFYIGSAVGLFVLAFAFGRTSAERPRLGWLAAMLFVQAFLHLMAAVVTGLVIASLLWFRAAPGRRIVQLGRIVAVGTPAMCVALLAVWVSRSSGLEAHGEPSTSTLGAWWIVGKCFMGGPPWRAWGLIGLAVSAPLLAAVFRNRGPMPSSVEDRALWLAGGVLLVAGTVSPLHLPYWEFFSVRFVPLAVCALVVTFPLERFDGALRWGVATALCGFAFVSTGWAFDYNVDLTRRGDAALAGLDLKVERPGARLPILLDVALGRPSDESQAMMPFVAPLANLGKLYATAQGGFVPETFAVDPAIHYALLKPDARKMPSGNSRHALVLAEPENEGNLALREAVTVHLAAHATFYDDIVFWGRPEDVGHLAWLGFFIEWQNEGFAIGRFEGCPLTVRVPASDIPLEQQTLELGWAPALAVTHRYPFSKARRSEAGDWVFKLRQTCGAYWLAVASQAAGETFACEGADAEGRLSVGVARKNPEVECRVRQRISTATR